MCVLLKMAGNGSQNYPVGVLSTLLLCQLSNHTTIHHKLGISTNSSQLLHFKNDVPHVAQAKAKSFEVLATPFLNIGEALSLVALYCSTISHNFTILEGAMYNSI